MKTLVVVAAAAVYLYALTGEATYRQPGQKSYRDFNDCSPRDRLYSYKRQH